MARLQKKALTAPEEIRRYPNGRIELTLLDEAVFAHGVNEPGWRWSRDVRPIVGTDWCENRHLGITRSGRLHVVLVDGSELTIGPDEAYEIPPGHDAWVEGDEPWDAYEFTSGGRTFALPPDEEDRRLATLLFTDIVDSTGHLERLGDRRWREVLLTHNGRLLERRQAFDGFDGLAGYRLRRVWFNPDPRGLIRLA